MKILQILPELEGGGVERGTLELGQILSQLGHQSLVVSHGGRLVAQLQQEGSRHIALPVHRKHPRSLWQVRALRKLFAAESPDVIHVRSRVPAWLTWLAWRKLPVEGRPKLVSTVHGFYTVNAYSRIMTCGEHVVCVSESVREYVLKNYPAVPASKLTVIHRGVDPQKLPYGYQPSDAWLTQWRRTWPQLKEKYVVTLPGRLTRWKGQLDFLKVIGAIKQRGVPVCGLIVGEPHPRKQEFLAEIQAQVQRFGLEDEIVFTGHRSDLKEVMAVSDVVVSCSTSPEAFGRVTLEALSLGRPVAGYDHGGVAEQLQVLLPQGRIPLGDTEQMASRLTDWSTNPPQPARSHPFTIDNFASKLLEIYESLL